MQLNVYDQTYAQMMFRLASYWIGNALLIIGTALVLQADGYTLSDVQNLKKDLITDRNYDKSMRPIFNQSKAIEVGNGNGLTWTICNFNSCLYNCFEFKKKLDQVALLFIIGCRIRECTKAMY